MNTISKTIGTLTIAGVAGLTATTAQADHIWINEFHYDNAGTDTGEFIEVGLRTPNGSGFTASDYSIVLYNGSNGSTYGSTRSITDGTITSFPVAGSTSTISLYTLMYPSNGIQNGSPDGIALVNTTNSSVEQFLSYEGTFTAVGGPADGLMSTDVGVAETGGDTGTSLSASGAGNGADEFDADSFILATTQTPGGINQGQTFVAGGAIPEPASLALLGLGGLMLMPRRRRA